MLIYLKQKELDFRSNDIIMYGWIAKRYEGKKDKLYTNYNNALFSISKDRVVFLALIVVLRLKTKIEVDEAILRMTYNIVETLICYEFAIFLSKGIKMNLVNALQGDFQHSSYLWWLVIDPYYPYFKIFWLNLMMPIFTSSNTPINVRVPSFTNKSGITYKFIEQFVITT